MDPELVRGLSRRSLGSPLVLQELVRALLDSGRLLPHWGRWNLEGGLEEILELPGGVLGVLVHRLADLPPVTGAILNAAAALGVRFELEPLARICGVEGDEVARAIAEATQAQLVERRGAGYNFVHDRVREALLSRQSQEDVAALHRRIADVVEGLPERSDAHIYAIARHRIRGGADSETLYGACRAAGMVALRNHAYEEAFGWLERAHHVAGAADPALEEALAEACSHTARLGKAVEYLESALSRTGEPVKRARLRASLARVHYSNFDTVRAVQEGRAGLSELGWGYPRGTLAQVGSILWNWGVAFFMSRTGWRFGTARGHELERFRTVVQLYYTLGHVSYFKNRPVQLLQFAFGASYAAYRVGPSRELTLYYSSNALIRALLGLPSRASHYARKAVELARDLRDPTLMAHCLEFQALATSLAGDCLAAEDMTRCCLQDHGLWLDSQEYFNSSFDLVFNLRLRGYYREALHWMREAIHKSETSAPHLSHAVQSLASGGILAALGRSAEGLQDLERFRSILAPKERFRRAIYLQQLLLFFLEHGEFGTPFEEAIQEHGTLGMGPVLCPFHLREFYVLQAYGRLAQAEAAPTSSRGPALRLLLAALRELRRAARVSVVASHRWVIEGAYEELRGRRPRAMKHFARAETLARRIDNPWVLYEVARRQARILQSEGNSRAALREARRAFELAEEHGWVFRARGVRTEFGLHHGSTVQATRSVSQSPHASRHHRLLDALLEVSLTSPTRFDARVVLDRIVTILGAERAFLFVVGEHGQLNQVAGRDSRGADLEELTGYSRTLVERVRATGAPQVIGAGEPGPDSGSASIMVHGLRSLMAVPLKVGERLLGIVYLDNRLARGMFTEEDVDILMALANQIAVGMETARAAQLEIAVETESRQRKLAEALGRLTHALTATLIPREVLSNLLQGLADFLPYETAMATWRPPGSGEDLTLVARAGGEPVEDPAAVQRLQQGGTIRCPLIDDSGALVLKGPALTGEHADLLSVVALQASVALRNAQLHHEVVDAYARLSESEAQLIQSSKMAAVGQLAAGVAHELNNPLGAVLLGLDMARMRLKSDPDVAGQQLNTARNAALRARSIVEKLLFYSREQRAPAREVDLNQVARDTMELLNHPLQLDKVQVTLELGETAPVLANQNELQQVITNLILNARDAVLEAGAAAREIRLTTGRDDHVWLEVQDRGPGIPPELQARIFDPFFTTKPVGKGTGLGLSLSSQIVLRYHGTLTVRSNPEGGTIFRVQLPRVP
ncbi:MAG: ATP-binding protein [Candidatus Eremiobacterota bacterium]